MKAPQATTSKRKTTYWTLQDVRSVVRVNDLVDSSQLGVDLQTDVVNGLRALGANGRVLPEDNLRRDPIDCVAQSLDARVDCVVLHGHDDHDHVRLLGHRELLVQSHKLLLDPEEIAELLERGRVLHSQASEFPFGPQGLDEGLLVDVGEVQEAPVTQSLAVDEAFFADVPLALARQNLGDGFALGIWIDMKSCK